MAEIVLAGSLATIDAVAELDNVEVAFHDALLAPNEFDKGGIVGFGSLAYHAVLVGQETVLGSLLADGAATTLATAFLAFDIRHLHLVDIEAMVIHIEAVLGDNDGVDQIFGNLAKRHIVALKAHYAIGVFHLLEETLDHQRRERGIENGTKQHLKDGKTPHGKDCDPNKTP